MLNFLLFWLFFSEYFSYKKLPNYNVSLIPYDSGSQPGVREEPTGVHKIKKPKWSLFGDTQRGYKSDLGGTQKGNILIWGYATTKRLRAPANNSLDETTVEYCLQTKYFWLTILFVSGFFSKKKKFLLCLNQYRNRNWKTQHTETKTKTKTEMVCYYNFLLMKWGCEVRRRG
jgi:hypothetical protein